MRFATGSGGEHERQELSALFRRYEQWRIAEHVRKRSAGAAGARRQ